MFSTLALLATAVLQAAAADGRPKKGGEYFAVGVGGAGTRMIDAALVRRLERPQGRGVALACSAASKLSFGRLPGGASMRRF